METYAAQFLFVEFLLASRVPFSAKLEASLLCSLDSAVRIPLICGHALEIVADLDEDKGAERRNEDSCDEHDLADQKVENESVAREYRLRLAGRAPPREEVLPHDAQCREKRGQDGEELGADVDEEEVVVADSHAVVHPGAVVVETLDAPLACRAVTGSGRSDDQTVRAKLAQVLIDFYYPREIYLRAEIAWVSEIGNNEESEGFKRQAND